MHWVVIHGQDHGPVASKGESVDSDQSPATIHLAHGELPAVGISLAKLKRCNASAFSFSVIVDEKRVTRLHFLKRIRNASRGQGFSRGFF